MQRNSTPNTERTAPPRLVEVFDGLVRPRGMAALFVSVLVIVVLVAAVLATPPISLGERLAEMSYQHVGKQGGAVRQSDGTELVIGGDSLSASTPLKMTIVPLADFISRPPAALKAATTLPQRLSLKSAVYVFDTRGKTVSNPKLSMMIPTDVRDDELSAVDMYAWNGTEWQWQPTTVLADDDLISSTFITLPKAVALFATTAPRTSVGALLTSVGALAEDSGDVLGDVTVQGLWVDTDGSIRGVLDDVPQVKNSRFLAIPTVQNWAGEKWNADLIANIAQNQNLRKAHIANLVALAERGAYAGINLDYRRLSAAPDDRANFVSFVSDLANELHSRRKVLILTLEAPTRVSDDPRPEFAWASGGYDWVALGRLADTVRVLIPAETGDQLTQLLRVTSFAVTQVNRQKLQPVIIATSTVVGSKGVSSISYDEALAMASAIEVVDLPKTVVAGESTLTMRYTYLTIGDSKTPFFWDAQARQYRFAFKDGNGVGTVWLQNSASIGQKLNALTPFVVKGAVLRDPTNERMDPAVWSMLRSYVGTGRAPVSDPATDMLRPTWQASGGEVLPGSTQAEITWKAPKEAGRYTVQAALPTALSSRGGQAISIDVVAPTPTPTPTPTRAPTPTALPPTPTPVPVVVARAPTAVPAPAASSAVGKYGFDYGIQAAVKDQDYNAVLNAVSGMGFRWVKQQVRWEELEPNKGNYQLGGLDGAVNAMSSRGIKIMLSVVTSPSWANPAHGGPPRNFNDYADFVGELARRYKGKVQAYEVWNEQNMAYEWKGEGVNAGRYIELLRITYPRIKAADPDAVVVAGALTPTGVNDPNIAVDDRLYLRQMYEAGLRGISDAIGVHPSGFASPADAHWPDAVANTPSHNSHPSFYFRNTMEDYRNIMIEFGDSGKQLWPTEFGWCAASKPVAGYEYCAYNNENTRAQYVVRAYQMAKAWGFVGPMFLWNLNWRVFEPGGEQAQFGIMDQGWRATPSYNALRDMPK